MATSKAAERNLRIQAYVQDHVNAPTKTQFLKDLRDFCGHGQNVFVRGAPDQTAFNNGKQSVANYLTKLEQE